tara:strand:- start:638 stop:1006 length:369 start_codon:yes stop_codon:yes gene_type:complete
MSKSFFKTEKIQIIKNSKGNLYKMLSKKHNFFKKFGEIYFSEVHPKKFKGWKYHEKRTQIMTVISGKIRFFLKKKISDKPKQIDISFSKKIKLLKIEPKVFYSFKCLSKKKSLIVNLIDEAI